MAKKYSRFQWSTDGILEYLGRLYAPNMVEIRRVVMDEIN